MNTIQNIKRIINTFGTFSMSDLQDEASVVVNSIGKDNFQLAERFSESGVSVFTYVYDMEVGEDFIEYEDLSNDVIEEINILAEIYEANCVRIGNEI